MAALALAPEAAAPRLQRARGVGRLVTKQRDGTTTIAALYQEGCAKIRLPHTHDQSLQAVLINTAGGLCGGDDLSWQAEAAPGARLVLTTQACERVYRSLGDTTSIATRLSVGRGARLDWLPQETILFEDARLARTLDVDLEADATFCAVEAVLLGRTAMGESARNARLGDSWRIRRDGRLVHAESTQLSGVALERDGVSLLAGANAFATVLYVGADAEARLAAARGLLGGTSGASVIGERLVVRAMAPSGMLLRRVLVPVLLALCAAGTLPRLWHL